jgi:hypothetical protein
MTNPVYQDVPYTFHSANVEDAEAIQACLELASLFADNPLPAKAVPFMQKLGTPLLVEGTSYLLAGIRLEVGKGTTGYQLLLKKRTPEDATRYRMSLPRFPLMTRLHADGESVCPLTMVSGAAAALVRMLRVVEGIHPARGRRMGPFCLEASHHLHRLASEGFKKSLSIVITMDSFIVSVGSDDESDEMEDTVYAVHIPRA